MQQSYNEEELEQGLAIDEHALEEALSQQVDYFYRVSHELARMISLRDEAKQSLAEIEAKVDQQVRHDASISDEKVTEKSIENQRKLDKSVQVAVRKLLTLNHDVGMLSALKEAYAQRGYALKEMVALYLANYYGNLEERPANKYSTDELKARKAERAKIEMTKMRQGRQ